MVVVVVVVMVGDYWEMYAPVVNWLSVCTLMLLSALHDREAMSIVFTLVFLQVDLDIDVFILLPAGFDLGHDSRNYVIKLNKSIPGFKKVTHNWIELLISKKELLTHVPLSRKIP